MNMAQVLGEAGRYVSQEAVRKRHRISLWCMVAFLLLGILAGLLASVFLPTLGLGKSLTWPFLLILLAAVLFINKYMSKKMDELCQQEFAMRKGALGEAAIGALLKNFPQEFRV